MIDTTTTTIPPPSPSLAAAAPRLNEACQWVCSDIADELWLLSERYFMFLFHFFLFGLAIALSFNQYRKGNIFIKTKKRKQNNS